MSVYLLHTETHGPQIVELGKESSRTTNLILIKEVYSSLHFRLYVANIFSF